MIAGTVQFEQERNIILKSVNRELGDNVLWVCGWPTSTVPASHSLWFLSREDTPWGLKSPWGIWRPSKKRNILKTN